MKRIIPFVLKFNFYRKSCFKTWK